MLDISRCFKTRDILYRHLRDPQNQGPVGMNLNIGVTDEYAAPSACYASQRSRRHNVALNLWILLRVPLTLGLLFQRNIRISPATVSHYQPCYAREHHL